jgi:hypothetical protein
LVLSPTDPEAEDSNTFWLGASPHERLGVSVDEIVAAFEELAGHIRGRVGQIGFRGQATFYVWHAREAGQLRCSTSSGTPEGLPLRGPYQMTADLGGIVTEFLADGEAGFVRFGVIKPIDDTGTVTYEPLAVWTCDVTAEAVP